MSESISTATVPTPGSASGVAGSATTTSSYPADFDNYFCAFINGYTVVNTYNTGNGEQCVYAEPQEPTARTVTYSAVYESPCSYGGNLLGSNCYYTTSTTPDVNFTWKTPTAYDASGQNFVTGVDVVEGPSCSTSSWKVVATVSPSADSYTLDNPSTSEYYGLQTIGIGGWTSAVSGCTLG